MTPLTGVTVVDLSQNLAGPYCTQALADLGARVIKVEPPGGDPARGWGPPFRDGQSTLFLSANRGKQSIILDLREEHGRQVLRGLIETADIFVQSFRLGVIDALGFGYEQVRRIRPSIVYVSVTAYGTRGPLAPLPGYDPLLQARGGLMSVTGHTGHPARVGTSIIDMGTGMWAALGVLASLRERDRTGEGTHLVASLYDTALAWSGYHLLGYFANGVVPGPLGAGFPSIAPYNAFPCADGTLMIAAANDGLFHRLCTALDLADLAEDPRYRDNHGRVQHRADLETRIAAVTSGVARADVERRLVTAGVPCAPILGMDEVARDPQAAAANMFNPGDGARAGVALPLEWGGVRATATSPPPLPGEHTAAILMEFGQPPV